MERTPEQKAAAQMPKWLLYGLIAKGVVVIAVTIGVLYYAGIF